MTPGYDIMINNDKGLWWPGGEGKRGVAVHLDIPPQIFKLKLERY